MHVAITGASGFLGTLLARDLEAEGHQVTRFVRRPARAASEAQWDAVTLPVAALDGVDAVVHLSGAGIGDKRWSPSYRQEILSSRTVTTAAVARAVAAAGTPVLLSGSGAGFYGATGEGEVDETWPAGTGFLPDVCKAWEAAADPARETARVVHLRTVPVLGAEGMMSRLRPLFKAGLGAPLGTGRQWFSWIGAEDWSRATRHLLSSSLEGPVNLTAPEPLRNKDFTKALGRAVHRPTLPVAVPAPVLRLALGGLATEVLDSQRVVPAKLLADGFAFATRDIGSALDAAVR